MSDYINGILLALLGAAGTALWYLVRRYNEKHPVNEEIDRLKRLADLKASLDAHQYSIDDIRQLEAQLMGKAIVAKNLSESFAEEAAKYRSALMSKAECQAEMSMAAYEAYQRSEKRLAQAIENLKAYMEPEEIEALDASQAAWRAYQEKYAEAVTIQYGAGTIRPMLYATELESITIARVIELKAEYNQRSGLFVPVSDRQLPIASQEEDVGR